jgi:hypothetical protein
MLVVRGHTGRLLPAWVLCSSVRHLSCLQSIHVLSAVPWCFIHSPQEIGTTSSMSRKDYKLIAEVIKTLGIPRGEQIIIAYALSQAFAANYPNFNSQKFMEAAL